MRILFLTQIIPYPPDAGPKVKTWYVLRYLVGYGHEVILASFVREDEKPFVHTLRKLCSEVYAIPIKRSRLKDIYYGLRSQFTGRPFLIERDDIPMMRTRIKEIVERKHIDAVHADQLTMSQYAFGTNFPNLQRPLLVFDAHNAVWNILERSQKNFPLLLRPMLKLETKRVKRYEGMIIDEFDYTLTVTDFDQQDLSKAWEIYLKNSQAKRDTNRPNKEPQFITIPITVDTRELKPIQRRPKSKNIITLGTLHYPPNADGIRWFVREVFPLITLKIPEVKLIIVGKNPPKDLSQLAKSEPELYTITGYVPDLQPYLEDSTLMVVPVRAGSGMRVRILDAFARAMPVVTTSVGLEGIEATPGEDVFVADTPKEFAETVIRLLEDPTLQSQLALNGRMIAENRYDWRTRLRELEAIYKD